MTHKTQSWSILSASFASLPLVLPLRSIQRDAPDIQDVVASNEDFAQCAVGFSVLNLLCVCELSSGSTPTPPHDPMVRYTHLQVHVSVRGNEVSPVLETPL